MTAMDPNSKRFRAGPLAYLTEDEMLDIHSAALEVLEETGTVVHHEAALALLEEAGASVIGPQRVSIPSSLVEWAVRGAPSRVTLHNRRGEPALFLEGRNVYFGTGSDCQHLLDTETGERRDFLYRDIEDAVRLVDALPNIDFTMSMGLGSDLATDIRPQRKFAAMLRHSVKPQVITRATPSVLTDILDMASAVIGSRKELSRKPVFALLADPTSPLVHSFEALENVLFMAENRLPLIYSPGIMAGATGPVTPAGAIVLANAEILSGLVIHQLKRPGAPFIFGGGMSPLDMSSVQPTYAAPEAMISQAGLCQMGRAYYRLPTWGFSGCSASKLADEQAVNEAAQYFLMSAWSGTNLVHDVGYLEFGLTYSYAFLVMCDEIIGQVRRLMAGIRVDREYLAVEAIKQVGPGGGFLGHRHTLNHFRENWWPGLTDRRSFTAWKTDGGTTMGERAREKAARILETHRHEPLPGEIDRQVEAILQRGIQNSIQEAAG